MFHRAKVGYKLPGKEAVMSEFPSDQDLSLLGVNLSDIEDVKYSHYYPGDPYTELGVARTGHEAMGSFSADMLLKQGLQAAVSRILYQDLKPHPPIGVPHWNQETRVMRTDWTKPKFHKEPLEHHQIPKSDSIDIIQEVQGKKTKTTLKWCATRYRPWRDSFLIGVEHFKRALQRRRCQSVVCRVNSETNQG